MAFITTIPVEQAEGEVKELYARSQSASGYVPNYTKLFSLRPQVYDAWGHLLGSIRTNLDTRRYELVTLAAAQALQSSYCMLAHGRILRQQFFSSAQLETIVSDAQQSDLDAVDRAIMAFVTQVVRNASAISPEDVEGLRRVGLNDSEIFDIAAAAAARCFFSTLLDALGAEADSTYNELEPPLRQQLTVGRPISPLAPEQLTH